MFKVALVVTQDGEDFYNSTWHGLDMANLVEFEETLANGLFALARKKMAEKPSSPT